MILGRGHWLCVEGEGGGSGGVWRGGGTLLVCK